LNVDVKLSIDMNDLMRLLLQLPEKQRASLRATRTIFGPEWIA